MKRLNDYSNEELLALDNDKTKLLIAIEAMVAGIEDPGERPVAPEAPAIEKTVPMYQVGNLLFDTQKEAAKAAELCAFKSNYDYACGYDYNYVERDELEIKKVMFYSKDDVMKMAVELKRYREAKNKYENDLRAYNKRFEALDGIRKKLFDSIDEARELRDRQQTLKAAYKRYLELADGDAEVAGKFFQNTYGIPAPEADEG